MIWAIAVLVAVNLVWSFFLTCILGKLAIVIRQLNDLTEERATSTMTALTALTQGFDDVATVCNKVTEAHNLNQALLTSVVTGMMSEGMYKIEKGTSH